MSPTISDEPYNSDPADQAGPESNAAATVAWGKAMMKYWVENPETPFTWANIQFDAGREYEARLSDFGFQKNSEMVDWMLDHPPENDLPADLLVRTQKYTRDNWEVIK
jgi:hypothetical protein